MSFYTDVIARSAAFRSDVVCKDTALLEPGTRAAVQALIAEGVASAFMADLLHIEVPA